VCAARQCSEDLYPENARLFGRNNHSINNRLKSLSSAVLCQLFLGEEVPLGVKKLLKANVGRFVNPTGFLSAKIYWRRGANVPVKTKEALFEAPLLFVKHLG